MHHGSPRCLRVRTGHHPWAAWKAAYGGNPNTFKSAVKRLRDAGLVDYDDATRTYSTNQFEITQQVQLDSGERTVTAVGT